MADKLELTFADFKALVEPKGYEAFEYEYSNTRLFYVKAGEHKVKVELRLQSGQYVLAYGMKEAELATIAASVAEQNFTIAKVVKKYIVVDYKGLPAFADLIDAVVVADGLLPAKEVKIKAVKEPKAPKEPKVSVKVERVAKVKAPAPIKSDAELEVIKSKNLAKLKAIGDKMKRVSQEAQGIGQATGVPNFDPEEAKAYVQAVTDDLENFKAPETLTKAEVINLVG